MSPVLVKNISEEAADCVYSTFRIDRYHASGARYTIDLCDEYGVSLDAEAVVEPGEPLRVMVRCSGSSDEDGDLKVQVEDGTTFTVSRYDAGLSNTMVHDEFSGGEVVSLLGVPDKPVLEAAMSFCRFHRHYERLNHTTTPILDWKQQHEWYAGKPYETIVPRLAVSHGDVEPMHMACLSEMWKNPRLLLTLKRASSYLDIPALSAATTCVLAHQVAQGRAQAIVTLGSFDSEDDCITVKVAIEGDHAHYPHASSLEIPNQPHISLH